jgi:predicted RNA binding protein YcfA (HicA-like mRNA interferase family)
VDGEAVTANRDLTRVLRGPHRQLARDAIERGWTLRRLNGGHLRLDHPNGKDCVVFPASASDWRAWKNLRSHIRRIERRIDEEASRRRHPTSN